MSVWQSASGCTAAALASCVLDARSHKLNRLTSRASCGAAYVFQQREAIYKLGGNELLNAVQGPCQQRGIRCTDVNGTSQLILFERV